MSNAPGGRSYQGQGYPQPGFAPPPPSQAPPGYPQDRRLPPPTYGSQPPQRQQHWPQQYPQNAPYQQQQQPYGRQSDWRQQQPQQYASGSRGPFAPPPVASRQGGFLPPPTMGVGANGHSAYRPRAPADDGRWSYQDYGAQPRSYEGRSDGRSAHVPGAYARSQPPGQTRSSKSPEWSGRRSTAELFSPPMPGAGRPFSGCGNGAPSPRGPSYVPPASRDRPPKTKRRTEPREGYLATSLDPSTRLDPATAERADRKLILLDLNGSLVFRANKQKADMYRRRPFVGNFIEYLRRRWEVGVWSSAQPHSVEKMVQSIGLKTRAKPALKRDGTPSAEAAAAGEVELAPTTPAATEADEADKALTLKVLWARDTFGLTAYEYNQKTETIKDLDLIWKHLNAEDAQTAAPRAQPYDALNTLLLDDSYTKTSCQPFNHLPVPDFGQSIATQSAKAFRAALAFSRDGDGLAAELAAELATCAVDRSLLGIIGILERARAETNVAGWIRAGGLVPDLADPDGWWTADDASADSDNAAPAPAGKKVKRSKKAKLRKTMTAGGLHALVFPDAPTEPAPYQPTAAELSPTATPPVPWYASPAHADFWTRRGVDALLEMGIALDFAMAVDFLPPTRDEIDAARAKREEKRQVDADAAVALEGENGGPVAGTRRP